MIHAFPYIGVTGFMHRPEVKALLEQFPEGSRRMLMVGVLASEKTLSGKQNKWPGRFPKIGDAAGIFCDHPQALNLIHYSTDNPLTLGEQLASLHPFGGPHYHGVQLNVPWPPLSALKRYRHVFPGAYIVLQVGQRAFQDVDEHMGACIGRIGTYRTLIDEALFDLSGGLGVPIDVEKGRAFLTCMQGEECGTGAIAGGFSARTLPVLEELFQEFPDVSIDAEGRLRHPDNDDLDLSSAVAYIQTARRLLSVPSSVHP